MAQESQVRKAIVLSGGGARGAYQVGVLKALSQVAQEKNIDPQIQIYTGISAGAINAGYMAAHADNFHLGVKTLVEFWSQLSSDQVFSSDVMHMSKIAFQWMGELSLGGLIGTTPGRSLLETSPLKKLIAENLPFDKIQKNIDDNKLHAVAITATDYSSSNSVTFVQGNASVPSWTKTRRLSKAAILDTSHIMASSAIPLLFPPIAVGQKYFGDGCVRNSSPCAPSIYVGGEKLLVIGVRMQKPTSFDQRAQARPQAPSVALVMNVLMNAVLLDGIEMDVERLQRMNQFIDQVPKNFHEGLNYRKVEAHLVAPSQDIGRLAVENAKQIPRIVRYLVKGLGSLEDASEIVSYLLFDPLFCQQLIEMGYRDGLRERAKLESFLS